MNACYSFLKLIKPQLAHHLQKPYTTAAAASAQFSNPPLTSLQCGALLQTLTTSKSVSQGQQLHAYLITSNTLRKNTYLSTKLAAFFASCGHMDHAVEIFDRVKVKNSFLWNSIIRGFVCGGFPEKGLMLYCRMLECGLEGDNFTYPFVLKACGELGLSRVGRNVHCQAVVGGFGEDVYVGNSLVLMYSSFGEMEVAGLVFDEMPVRDLTSWNTFISRFGKNGEPKKALAIFAELVKSRSLVGDGVTMLGLVSACGGLKDVNLEKEVHGYVVRNGFVECNSFLGNSLIDLYCGCGNLLYARRLFEVISWRDTVSWNSLISGYAKNDDAVGSLWLFCEMIFEGLRPDQVTVATVLGACDQITALQFGTSVHSFILKVGFGASTVVGTTLVDMYSKCGSLLCSRLAFDEIANKSLVTWSTMISGYGLHGKGKEAVCLFQEMIATGVMPDNAVFTSVMSACSHAGLVQEGKEIFQKTSRECNMKPGLLQYTCLVDLLGQAGHLNEAYYVIQTMDPKPNVDVWAAFLSACRLHKNIELAEASAFELIRLNPSRVSSYVCLSNTYAAEKKWNDVENVRNIVGTNGLRKSPSWSSIEFD